MLVGAGLDAEDARRAAIAETRRAVGFTRWCWPLTDPGSVLSMSGIAEFDLWPSLPRLIALEEHGDITSKPRLVAGPSASVALSGATAGDLARSRRWRECLSPYGIGDELMTACRDRHGCWGSVELMRDSDDAPFDEHDVRLLDELAPALGALIRRGLVQSWQADGGEHRPLPPATLIVDTDLHPTSWTPAFNQWLAELSGGGPSAGSDLLPPAIYEIGARALTPADAVTGLPASVRIRTPNGRWAALEGARLEGTEHGKVAITMRGASSEEVFDLLCRAHALTRRERQLVALVLNGLATKQLAEALFISPHTVQDHLKSIFEKTGARSRHELIAYLAGRMPNRGHGLAEGPPVRPAREERRFARSSRS